MITYATVSSEPTVLKSLTGMTESEFADLLQDLGPLYEASEAQRLNRPDRQRAPGGGSKHKHDLSERLLMTLMRLHLRLTTEALGLLFDVNKSTVSRNVRHLLPLLQELGQEETHEWLERGHKRGRSLEEVLRQSPDLAPLINITEYQVRSSQNSESGIVAGGTQTSSVLPSSVQASGPPRKPGEMDWLHQLPAALQQGGLDPSKYRLVVAFILAIAALLLLTLNTAQGLRSVPYAI